METWVQGALRGLGGVTVTGLREAVAYILARGGCMHPFRFSRILALAELHTLRKTGKRLTDAVYVTGPGVFFIEGLKDIIEGSECFVKHEGDPATGRRGCIEYRCSIPQLPGEAVEALDCALREASKLDDMELNQRVLGDSLFKRLTGENS